MKCNQSGIGHTNYPLRELRHSKNWTLQQMGKKLGFELHTVERIERGVACGKLDYWQAIQTAFDIPNEKMWYYITGGDSDGNIE